MLRFLDGLFKRKFKTINMKKLAWLIFGCIVECAHRVYMRQLAHPRSREGMWA